MGGRLAYRVGGDEFASCSTGGEGRRDEVAKRAAEALTASGTGFELSAAWGAAAIPAEAATPPPRCSSPTCGCTRRRSRDESPTMTRSTIDAADVVGALDGRGTAKLSSSAVRTAVDLGPAGGVVGASHEHRRLVERSQQQWAIGLTGSWRSHPPRSPPAGWPRSTPGRCPAPISRQRSQPSTAGRVVQGDPL